MSATQVLDEIRKAIVSLSITSTEAATKRALDQGVDPLEIIKSGLAAGLTEVGDNWARQEVFISEVLVAGKAMKAGQTLVEEKLAGKEGDYKATLVIGTPKGDLHDIGKNLISMMMRAGGFKVYDLGVDVEPQVFIDKAKEVDADLIGVSLIMSICLDQVEKICRLTKTEAIRAKIIIGGAATSEKVAAELGAGAYGGFDAPTGVRTAEKLLGIT